MSWTNQVEDSAAGRASTVGESGSDGFVGRSAVASEFTRLSGIVAALREHCAWTRRLDHYSLLGYLLEEAHEVIETVESGGGPEQLRGELADVLLQVVLHAQIAQESGSFDFADVARELSAKLIRRNPHVFSPDGSLAPDSSASIAQIEAAWKKAKAEEEPSRGVFAGIPPSLPALSLTQKTLRRLAGTSEGSAAARETPGALDARELGDMLFDVVQKAAPGVDAEQALRAAVARFREDREPA